MTNRTIKAMVVFLMLFILTACDDALDFALTNSGTMVTEHFNYLDSNGEKLKILFTREHTFYKSSKVGHTNQLRLIKVEFYFSETSLNDFFKKDYVVEFNKVGELNGDLSSHFIEFYSFSNGKRINSIARRSDSTDQETLCEFYLGQCEVVVLEEQKIDSMIADSYERGRTFMHQGRKYEIEVSRAGTYEGYLTAISDSNDNSMINFKFGKFNDEFSMRIHSWNQ